MMIIRHVHMVGFIVYRNKYRSINVAFKAVKYRFFFSFSFDVVHIFPALPAYL